MSTAVFYDLENISKFTAPKNYNEFKDSFKMMCDSELVDDVVLQRAYISTAHPAYIKYNKYLNSTGIEICAVDPNMNSKKANLVDFKMNVDCIAYSLSNNIDTVVIATGDADFGFLCEELKNYGKKVVVASYGITTNKSIIMLCDDWVDFSHEYTLCDINELMTARIRLDEPVDYKAAVRGVLSAMLSDKLVKRYMALERFDLDMLYSFTEQFYKAPRLDDMSYIDFVSMLISGINVSFRNKNGHILIVPAEECIPEPPLSIYEIISGMDFEFSTDRFRAWHSWFEENLDSARELVYYMNFMTRNNLLYIGDDEARIIPQRKCATALVDHTSMALSLLNIKPEEKELEKLRSRFYRNPLKHRPQKQQTEAAAEEIIEPAIYIQGTMTNFGRIVVYADDEAVFKVEFTDEFVKYNPNEITSLAAKELREYFKGERQEFSVPVRFNGSEFQKRVWEALRQIPYGETRTYKDIANAIGKPKSARAIGRACNTNAILFIVPCHRVTASSGDMSGFRAGVELKTALLKSESSPEDFKRFGKQYSFNVKHPDSRCEYRTSEEIRRVLEEEIQSSEDLDESDNNANTRPETEPVNPVEQPAESDKQAEPQNEEPVTEVSISENTDTRPEPESAVKADEQPEMKADENAGKQTVIEADVKADEQMVIEADVKADEQMVIEADVKADEQSVIEADVKTEADNPVDNDNTDTGAVTEIPEISEEAPVTEIAEINNGENQEVQDDDEPQNAEAENTEASVEKQDENIVKEVSDNADTESISKPLNDAEPSPDTDLATASNASEEAPSPQTRKRRAPYKRRTKRPSDGKTARKYSAKKHTVKPNEDNG